MTLHLTTCKPARFSANEDSDVAHDADRALKKHDGKEMKVIFPGTGSDKPKHFCRIVFGQTKTLFQQANAVKARAQDLMV
jgi:hypothetical protein